MPNRYAQQINALVTIPDVLQRYGYGLGRNRRIPCPIHHGKDANFCYTDHVYHCWSCDARGDVIKLVQELFDIGFSQAVVKINADFALGLPLGRPTRRDLEMDRQRRTEQIRMREEKRMKREYYLRQSDLYRTLYRQQQNGPKIDGLDEYIDQLEEWLEGHIEEVRT